MSGTYNDSNVLSNIPNDRKSLRACRICGFIKSAQQFEDDGCPNCKHIWQGASMLRMTTPHFCGMIAIMNTKASWVAKAQLMNKNMTPGIYSVAIDPLEKLTPQQARREEESDY